MEPEPEPVQPGVFLVVRLPDLVECRAVVGEGAGFGQSAGEGAGLVQVVVGALVVFGGCECSLQADDADQDRQRQGAELEVLLDDQAADGGRDRQDVVGQDGALVLGLAELLAVLLPVRTELSAPARIRGGTE